ncbi:MAG: GlcG/HbpS family heme-binding protein [Rhodospirillales bacterium]
MEVYVSSHRLTSDAALAAAEGAIAKARDLGVKINVAVVDAGGHLLAFRRDDSASLPSIVIAQDKAYTSVGFRTSSRNLAERISADPDVRDGIVKQPRLAAFPGGLPILVEGQVVGGIGVSGASADQDEECAEAGLVAIGLST